RRRVVGGAFAAARARHRRRPRGAGLRPLLSRRHATACGLAFHRGGCRASAHENLSVVSIEEPKNHERGWEGLFFPNKVTGSRRSPLICSFDSKLYSETAQQI